MADPKPTPKPNADWWTKNSTVTNGVIKFFNDTAAKNKGLPKAKGRTFITPEGINSVQKYNQQANADVAGFFYDTFTPGMNKTAAGRAAAMAPKTTLPSMGKPGVTGPATGGSVMDNYNLNQVAANAAQQRMAGQQSQAGTTGGGMPTGSPQAAPQRFTADDLYIDPTQAYQPVLDQYAQQQAQLQDRYAANAADIKNIFGNLTTVRALDKTKIAQQYQTSIQQQQDALAARTAETRMNTEAGQQGAATAAAEMGTAGQPAPTDSLTAQASEQGVADSNAYQTTWAALQNVMSQQAQNDVQSAVQGYDYQQAAGLEQLRMNLEDRLAAIQGDMAGTQSQLAQAKLSGQQNVANAKYSEELQRRAAAQSLAAAQASAANKRPSYAKDSFGLQQRAADAGVDYSQIQSTVNEAYNSAYALLNPEGSQKKTTPKKSDILNAWNAIKGGSPQTAAKLSPYVTAYVDQMF